MNKWECQEPGCGVVAVGVGGAIGLRAVGWYFEQGPYIYCPRHHPLPAAVTYPRYMECSKDECPECFANSEAEYYQRLIRSQYDRQEDER